MMAGADILVVDDDAWILRMVTMILEKKGHRVRTAVDGSDGLKQAMAQVPDLIITDVMMPHADGWSLVKQLRTRPEFAFVPVIFLTALGSDEDRIKGFRLGADDYIPKPFRFEELDLRVGRALRGRDRVRSEVFGAEGTQANTPTAGLRGQIRQLGIPSVLTMLEMERKSGVMTVMGPEAAVVRLYLRDGRLVSAALEGSPDCRNENALFHLLTWIDGEFEFVARAVDVEDEIRQGTTHLLMEGARRLDEEARFG